MSRALGLLLVVGLAACSGGQRPRAEPSPAAKSPAPLPEPSPAAAEPSPEPSAEELPVPEDFEAEAEREITPANYRKQLVALESELAALEAAPSAVKPSK